MKIVLIFISKETLRDSDGSIIVAKTALDKQQKLADEFLDYIDFTRDSSPLELKHWKTFPYPSTVTESDYVFVGVYECDMRKELESYTYTLVEESIEGSLVDTINEVLQIDKVDLPSFVVSYTFRCSKRIYNVVRGPHIDYPKKRQQ